MLRVALCDFNHTTVGIHTETMPLAIGLIGAYTLARFPGRVEIRLYKFADDFLQDLESWHPSIVGLSLYCWNTRLGLRMAQVAVERDADTIVVGGGPNIPLSEEDCSRFFQRNPFVDLLVNKDGEIPFSEIVAAVLSGVEKGEVYRSPIPGTIAFNSVKKSIELRPLGPKLKSLDEAPSPYLTGLMSKFFDYQAHTLAPFIETNRGCPFACTFCHTAQKYYTKVQWASLERLEQEMELFGQRFAGRHDVRLFLADNNFGSFTRDYEFARIVRRIQEEYDWPRYIDVTTGKTKPENILKVAAELKWGLTISSSLQTLTEKVLQNISRKNLEFDDLIRLQKRSRQSGNFTSTELILCLPGETKETFLETIRQVLDAGVEQMIIYTLMNLNGTPLYEYHHAHRKNHIFRYRIVPRQFGRYLDEPVFDVEEVVVQTPTFSYEDYLWCRGLAYVIQAVYNDSTFPELLVFLREVGADLLEWLLNIYERVRASDCRAGRHMKAFLDETEGELWSSEEALRRFYSQEANYRRLVKGEIGGNLLSKYAFRARTEGFEDWSRLVFAATEDILAECQLDLSHEEKRSLLKDFKEFFTVTRNLQFLFEGDDEAKLRTRRRIALRYNIPGWAEDRDMNKLLSHCRFHGHFDVYYTQEQIRWIEQIQRLEAKEREVRLQYILQGNSRDFWAHIEPTADAA